MEDTITALRSNLLTSPVAFANRYNGIDLPGDACRLLIISGIPRTMSEQQKLLSKKMYRSRLYARSIAQKIEQAIGRGTRGSGDYCVVVFYGHDLCDWVRDRKHLQYFTPATRAQIECGYEIMNQIDSAEELSVLIDQGASNDKEFALYLSEAVAEKVQEYGSNPLTIDSESFSIIERRSFELWRSGDTHEAVKHILHYAESNSEDFATRGIATQLAAQFLYTSGDIEKALYLQNMAHSLNNALVKSNSNFQTTDSLASEYTFTRQDNQAGLPQSQFDVFISHASEDKDTFVRPLAEKLREAGIHVWYDDYEIKIGDSLRAKIDEGLAKSRFGILVVSLSFLKKMSRNSWVSHEVDGLAENRNSDNRLLFPIWHNVKKSDIMKVSPSLSNISAADTSVNELEEIAEMIISRSNC